LFYTFDRKIGWSVTGTTPVSTPTGTTWTSIGTVGTVWQDANSPCPSGWRLPTKTDLEKLVAAPNSHDVVSGVSGRWFGTAPNRIFLPYVGYRDNSGTLTSSGSQAYYHSRTESGTGVSILRFSSGTAANIINNGSKFAAYSVRCVR